MLLLYSPANVVKFDGNLIDTLDEGCDSLWLLAA